MQTSSARRHPVPNPRPRCYVSATLMDQRNYTLTIHTRQEQDRVVLALSGELDLASTPLLERELKNARALRVVVDLSGLEFTDSAGFHTLVRAAHERLTIRPGHKSARRLFALTATQHLLKFEP